MSLCCRVGAWSDDVREGFGTYTLLSGDVYEGQYMADKKHGRGRFTPSGGSPQLGEWQDGVLIL